MLQFYYDGTLGDHSTLENMDKELIMKLDDEKDLLAKKLPVKGLAYHPIPFPTYRNVFVAPGEVTNTVLEHLKNYVDRMFLLMPENYGVSVSINYSDGLFQSMILKGDGQQGERINDDIAKMLVPAEAKSKKNITLHALLTVFDMQYFKGGVKKHEVARTVRQTLRDGFRRFEEKSIVCRPYALFTDGVRGDVYDVWEEIGNVLIGGLNMEYTFDEVLKYASEHIDEHNYNLPQCGLLIEDLNPSDNGAFPSTLFILDEETIDPS